MNSNGKAEKIEKNTIFAEKAEISLKLRKAEVFLEEYYKIQQEVDEIKRKIEEKYYSATDISIALTERVQSSSTGDSFSKSLIDMLDEQKMLEEYCCRERKKMQYILLIISKVRDGTQRGLIVMRYIESRSWKYISEIMHEDISGCYKKMRAGKLEIAEILERENPAWQ